MLELFHEWISSQSLKVRVMLAEKGLAWTGHRIELMKLEQTAPEYLAINSSGVVPSLRHDGKVILESSIICEYLEDVFPDRPVRSADPFARALERQWLKYQDEVVHPALRRASFQLLYKPALGRTPRAILDPRLANHPQPDRARNFAGALADPSPDWAAVGEAIGAYRSIIARLERALADGRPWLSGKSFGLADVAMSPFVDRLPRLGMEFLWEGSPRVLAWATRMLAHDALLIAQTPEEVRLPLPEAAAQTEVRRLAATMGRA